MQVINTENLKQYLLLVFIILLVLVLGWYLYPFIPGVLGAVTLYILMRQQFFNLTVIKNWKKWLTATLFIVIAAVIFVLPLALLLQMLIPKFYAFLQNASQLNNILGTFSVKLQRYAPGFAFDDEQIKALAERAASSAPTVFGATLTMLSNTVLAFFILYFMLVDGRKMERQIQLYLPLKEDNIDHIWQATRVMVVSNAIGIPVLAACQAAVAILGYYLFGIDSYIVWGVVTGIFSLVPIIGTAVIWVPLCIYLFSIGNSSQALGLLAYSVLVTTNVDNILRFTLLKKLGDVHPIITVLGIIVGVPMFGFMGFIFGPLLISYLLLLVQIYRVEFSSRKVNGE